MGSCSDYKMRARNLKGRWALFYLALYWREGAHTQVWELFLGKVTARMESVGLGGSQVQNTTPSSK